MGLCPFRACVRAACTGGTLSRKSLKGTWQAAGRLGKLAKENANGHPESGMPIDQAANCGSYWTEERNARRVLGGALSPPPLLFFESRTSTASAVVAASTHSPPLAPE